MREIKFRAKTTRCFPQRWIYGDLLQPTTLVCDNYEISDCNSVDGSRYDIDPETIGQYTGLHDKNSVEIYEGDIVKVKNCQYHIGQVIYDTEYAEYEIEIDKNTAFPISVCYGDASELDIEVIGNIHDNPDLLGEVIK